MDGCLHINMKFWQHKIYVVACCSVSLLAALCGRPADDETEGGAGSRWPLQNLDRVLCEASIRHLEFQPPVSKQYASSMSGKVCLPVWRRKQITIPSLGAMGRRGERREARGSGIEPMQSPPREAQSNILLNL